MDGRKKKHNERTMFNSQLGLILNCETIILYIIIMLLCWPDSCQRVNLNVTCFILLSPRIKMGLDAKWNFSSRKILKAKSAKAHCCVKTISVLIPNSGLFILLNRTVCYKPRTEVERTGSETFIAGPCLEYA